MDANTLTAATPTLGAFLRDRRARLRPEPGLASRRRTPGLRREEVAARAGVSVTWYTWLEQGRGGPPSEAALERLARALELDGAARELLFLLAQQRPPPLAPTSPVCVPPSLQRTLDAMPLTPAFVKTPAWDTVAWNRAALAVLGNWNALPPGGRNTLRGFFADPGMRVRMPDWEEDARSLVALFRLDVTRAGPASETAALCAELQATSPDFRRLWAQNEVRGPGVHLKRLRHPIVGPLTLEYQPFAVVGSEGLSLIVCTPASEADARAIETLLAATP